VAALAATHTELRTKSRDLVRRNAWAQAGIEDFVANAVGTGIKPQRRPCGGTGARRRMPRG
jgi:capsid protein